MHLELIPVISTGAFLTGEAPANPPVHNRGMNKPNQNQTRLPRFTEFPILYVHYVQKLIIVI